MTIYTSASRTHKPEHGICERGIENTQRVLAKLGLTMESLVTMELILDELGLCDCLYSFCEVRKGCEEEASFVLRNYMAYVRELTQEYLGVYVVVESVNKRLAGVMRPALLMRDHAAICDARAVLSDPIKMYGMDVYKCLASSFTDSQAANHASIALMDGAELLGKRAEVHDKLTQRLRSLLT